MAEDVAFRTLYRIGAAAAAAMVALIPVALVGFLVAPPPADAASAFASFERSSLAGLASLDLVYMLEILLGGVVMLVVAVALRRVSPSLVALATFFNVVATAMYFASNPAFEMLTLSRHHAAATTDAQRALFVAAGEAMLASYTGTAYDVSYVLAGAAGLLLALVMWKSNVFGRVTASLGIAMGVLALVPPTIGPVGYVAAFLYLLPFTVWGVLIAKRLFVLGRARGVRTQTWRARADGASARRSAAL